MSKLIEAQKLDIVNRHLKTPQGRTMIAKSMVEPLRTFQDYVSVGRKALAVRSLANGEDPLIDHDVDKNSMAYLIADDGENIKKVVNVATEKVQLFEIAANPTIKYTQIARRKYDIKNRVREVAMNEIFRAEDRKIFQTLLASATHRYLPMIFQKDKRSRNTLFVSGSEYIELPGEPANSLVTSTREDLSIEHINLAMSEIERNGHKPVNMFMNPYNAQLLRRINQNNNSGYYVDFETSQELIRTGFLATLFGLDIYTSIEIPEDVILITSAPEYTGLIMEGVPLSVIPYDETSNRAFGFSIFEEVGILCHNPIAVSAIVVEG